MQVEQTHWTQESGWQPKAPDQLNQAAQLVFIFGGTAVLKDHAKCAFIKGAYPNAYVIGCSTAGEIIGTRVYDDTLVVTAVHFKKSEVRGKKIKVDECESSMEVGKRLSEDLDHDRLRHVFVLSDGLNVNGSELAQGLSDNLPDDVHVTGGLSGDGDRFEETYVIGNDMPENGTVAVIGLYGKKLKIGFGSLGGWDPFGPERVITKAEGNILFELDGKSALELYKQYLGEHASGLPSTGLLFPLCVRSPGAETSIVRTILGISEDEQSMTFAGDVPVGSYARLMRANFDRLIDGAVEAAKNSYDTLGGKSPSLALLISCVGRKLVLSQRIEEEVEGVREILGEDTILAGFYSYGEISPVTPEASCQLHNQTMTITTISE